MEVDYAECKDMIVDDVTALKKKPSRLSAKDLKRKKKAKKEKEYRKLKKIMESESDSSDSDEEVDAGTLKPIFFYHYLKVRMNYYYYLSFEVKQTLRDVKKLKLDLVKACNKEPCNYQEIKGLLREMSKVILQA